MRDGEFHIIKGTNNIVLVAPHGYMEEHHRCRKGYCEDDRNTAELTMLLAEKLQCYAVINTVYRKPRTKGDEEEDIENKIVNLNDLRQYRTTPLYDEFVVPIVDVAHKFCKQKRPVYIFHIHGIGDKNIDDGYGVLLGLGLDKSYEYTSLSAPMEYADKLIKQLNSTGILSKLTHREKYAAKGAHNLNQLFRKNVEIDADVFSVQFEIKCLGHREEDSLMLTTERLATAIRNVTGVSCHSDAELLA